MGDGSNSNVMVIDRPASGGGVNQRAALGFDSGSAAGDLAQTQAGTISNVAREESEIKAAIVSAKRFPRNEQAAYLKILRACERPFFAENASYSFPRGDKTIFGPSVDLARDMARCWGNMRHGLRIVSIDSDLVHIKGFAIDVETNMLVEYEDKFSRLIQRKRGNKTEWVEPDERDLRELINRRGAICVRNAILDLIPSDITEEALLKCGDTLRAAAKGELTQNREDGIRRLVLAFDRIHMTPQMIEVFLGHPLLAMTDEEVVRLRGIYKSIADGNSRREEYFKLNPETGEIPDDGDGGSLGAPPADDFGVKSLIQHARVVGGFADDAAAAKGLESWYRATQKDAEPWEKFAGTTFTADVIMKLKADLTKANWSMYGGKPKGKK